MINHYRIVVDCWRMFRKHRQPAFCESVDWKALHEEALKIGKKYGETKFVKALIFAFLDEIERIELHGSKK